MPKNAALYKDDLEGQKHTDGTKDNNNDDNDVKTVSRKNLINTILSRVTFDYTILDIAKEYLQCIWCRKLKKKREREQFKKYLLYKKGLKKLYNNFDALSLLRSMQQLKLLS